MWRLLLLPGAAILFLAVALPTFYQGRYVSRVERPRVEDISVPSFALGEFLDVPAVRPGVLLLDQAHRNAFYEEDLDVLLSRVRARGYQVELLEAPEALEEKLRAAHAFLVVLPLEAYTGEEVQEVRDFVAQGGRLLLVGDPTSYHQLNSLARAFGLTFEADYLYNVAEHESNFRHIFLTDFSEHPLTQGLGKVVFYIASSITSPRGLIFTDRNTYSSSLERRGPFSVLAEGEGSVLAISDLTFMTQPFNTAYDNDRLISRLADFLTQGERAFLLADFPSFFQGEVDVVLGQDSLLEAGTRLRSLLASQGRRAQLKEREDFSRDSVFLGLYEDADQVAHHLTEARIRVAEALETPFSPPLLREGAGLLYLVRQESRHRLIILADTTDDITSLVALLETGQFRQGLVAGDAGLYSFPVTAPRRPLPTPRGAATPTPSLVPPRLPEERRQR